MRRLIAPLGRHLSRKNQAFLIALGLGIFATGSLLATAPRHTPQVVEEKVWSVSTVRAEPARLAAELPLFGRVETPRHAALAAALEAEVVAVHVSEGQQVDAGALLLTLDTSDSELRRQRQAAVVAEQAATLAALAEDFRSEREVLAHLRELEALTRTRLARLETLHNRQLVATEARDALRQEQARLGVELARQQALVNQHPQRRARAEAQLSRARAELAEAELAVSRGSLHAPFAGRVSALSVSTGERIRPGQSLVSLFDTRALRLRVTLPADAVPALRDALRRGQPVDARLAGLPFQARLSQLASELKPGASGVQALFALPPEAGAQLELGRALDLRVSLPLEQAVIALPLLSLYDNQRVYRVDNGRLQAVAVQPLGRRQNARGEIEVLIPASALPAGSAVLASDLPQASAGLRVEAVGDALAGAPPAVGSPPVLGV
jgi:multidrug resistance efflux pump